MVTMEVFVAAFSAFAVIFATAFFWILTEFRAMRKETKEDNRMTRVEVLEEIRAEGQRRREDTQRILEALYFHRHDAEGAAVFYPPTPTTPAD